MSKREAHKCVNQTRQNDPVLKKARRIVIHNMVESTLNAPRCNTFLSAPKRAQNKWSSMVQTPGKRDRENPHAEPIQENKKKTRTASCSNASLPRVKESRWHQQTGVDGRSVRPRRQETSSRRRVGKTTKKERANLQRDTERVAQQREGLGGQHLADFATVKVTRP